jgi:hypothetical protein
MMTPRRKTWSTTMNQRSGQHVLSVTEERGTQHDVDNVPFYKIAAFAGFEKRPVREMCGSHFWDTFFAMLKSQHSPRCQFCDSTKQQPFSDLRDSLEKKEPKPCLSLHSRRLKKSEIWRLARTRIKRR